jgi:hypothetical protein
MSRPWGQYALCLLLILGSLVCHAVIIASNVSFGLSLGDGDPIFSLSLAVLGAGVDIVGIAGLSAYAGILYRDGEKWNARGYRCTVGFFMALSMFAFYGFCAAHRIEPAARAVRQYAADVTATAKTNELQRDVRKGAIELLVKQAGDTEALARDKNQSKFSRELAVLQARDTKSAALNAAFRDIEVKPVPVFKDPDPQAKALSDDTGMSVTAVQKLLTMLLGFAAMLLSSIGTTAGVRKWPKHVKHEPVHKSDGMRSEPVTLDETWGELPSPQPSMGREAAVNAAAKALQADVVEISQAQDTIDTCVARFLKEATAACPGAVVSPGAFHTHFLAWCQLHDFSPVGSSVLGRAMVKAQRKGLEGAPRRKMDGRYNVYLDRMLVRVQGMAAA